MEEKLVLCVDKDELFLKMITSYLHAYGYAVVSETSGRRALMNVAERSFHAMILDCFLSDSQNCDVAIEMNRLHPEIPIIVLTAAKECVPARVTSIADAVFSKENALDKLIDVLDGVPCVPRPKGVRKFSRYPVRLPFTVRLMHSNCEVDLRGTTTTMSEGGLGGMLDSEIYPGEDVLIQFAEPRLQSLKAECRVRYRAGDIYGFEFLGLDSKQREMVRQSCSQWVSD